MMLTDKLRPWQENARFIKKGGGVYVLYNRNREILYIGESENLQETFTHYLDTSFEDDSCKQKTWFYQREFVDDPKKVKEILLEEYKEEQGKLPLCNEKTTTAVV